MSSKQVFVAVTNALFVALVGCSGSNEQLAEHAMEAARWQAEQNRAVLGSSEGLVQGTRDLVSADAAARHELAELQRELRQDQADISSQFQEMAAQQCRESFLGSLIIGVALLLACMAPLWLAACALFHRDQPLTQEELHAALHDSDSFIQRRRSIVSHRKHQNRSAR